MLDEAQEALLVLLVQADRRGPPDHRQPFRVHDPVGSPGMVVFHPGWLDKQRRVSEVNLETLASAGFLQRGYAGADTTYFVTPTGFKKFADIKIGKDGDTSVSTIPVTPTVFRDGTLHVPAVLAEQWVLPVHHNPRRGE